MVSLRRGEDDCDTVYTMRSRLRLGYYRMVMLVGRDAGVEYTRYELGDAAVAMVLVYS